MELGSINLQKFEGIFFGTQMVKSVGNWGEPKDFLEIPAFLKETLTSSSTYAKLCIYNPICDLPNDARKKNYPTVFHDEIPINFAIIPHYHARWWKQFFVKQWGEFFPPNFRGIQNIQIFANKNTMEIGPLRNLAIPFPNKTKMPKTGSP